MIEKAKLAGKAIFTGEGYSFNIWSADEHAAQQKADEAALADMDDSDDFALDFAAALEIAQ